MLILLRCSLLQNSCHFLLSPILTLHHVGDSLMPCNSVQYHNFLFFHAASAFKDLRHSDGMKIFLSGPSVCVAVFYRRPFLEWTAFRNKFAHVFIYCWVIVCVCGVCFYVDGWVKRVDYCADQFPFLQWKTKKMSLYVAAGFVFLAS